jgi:hypothetical protein
MHNGRPATLDEALESLPRDIEPSRTVWSKIRAEIAAEAHAPARTGGLGWWGQLGIAAALVLVTATTTYIATRQSILANTSVVVAGAPNLFDPTNLDGKALGEQYLRARADLDRLFAERFAALPPATRAKLESNLADLRRAADEIVATLAEHPSDPLLQELLISTRQRELQLLAEVGQLPLPNS